MKKEVITMAIKENRPDGGIELENDGDRITTALSVKDGKEPIAEITVADWLGDDATYRFDQLEDLDALIESLCQLRKMMI